MNNEREILVNELEWIQNSLTELWGLLNNVYEYEDETAKTSIKTINDWFDENAVAMVDNKSIDLGRDIEERLMSVHQKINNILDNGELTEEEAKEAAAYVDETQNRLGAILSGRKE